MQALQKIVAAVKKRRCKYNALVRNAIAQHTIATANVMEIAHAKVIITNAIANVIAVKKLTN